MAKRHRTRPRAKRVEPVRRAAAPAREDADTPTAARVAAHRPARTGAPRVARGGYARAIGTPSAPLERAATAERGFIRKDFRRLGLVIGGCAALLIVAGVLESVLLR